SETGEGGELRQLGEGGGGEGPAQPQLLQARQGGGAESDHLCVRKVGAGRGEVTESGQHPQLRGDQEALCQLLATVEIETDEGQAEEGGEMGGGWGEGVRPER